jgi:hypothetical protein
MMFDMWELKGYNPLPCMTATMERPLMSKELPPASPAARDLVQQCRDAVPDFNEWIVSPEGKAALAEKRAENAAKDKT